MHKSRCMSCNAKHMYLMLLYYLHYVTNLKFFGKFFFCAEFLHRAISKYFGKYKASASAALLLTLYNKYKFF